MAEEDYNKIAEEFGEAPPKEKKPDPFNESEQPKKVKSHPNLKKPKHHDKPTFIRITNGFVFGSEAALGFWIVTLLLAAIVYLAITYAGFYP